MAALTAQVSWRRHDDVTHPPGGAAQHVVRVAVVVEAGTSRLRELRGPFRHEYSVSYTQKPLEIRIHAHCLLSNSGCKAV